MTFDLRSLVVIGVVVVACVCDLRTRRIPNALTLGAAVAAFAFALLENGVSGLGWSAAGWLISIVVFFPFFALGGMGAGDVKLLGALGAWFGALDALHLALYTALAGGAMGAVVSYARGYLSTALWNLWLLVAFWRTAGLRPHPELTLRSARGPKLAYALPIAVGAVTTLWLR
jgi:prepilin peptidase CpaA